MNKYSGLNGTEHYNALKVVTPGIVAGALVSWLLLFTDRGQNVVRDVSNDLFAPKSRNIIKVTADNGKEVSSVYQTPNGKLMVCVPSNIAFFDKECGEDADDFDQTQRPAFLVLKRMAESRLAASAVDPH